jgi:hypothetical protein
MVSLPDLPSNIARLDQRGVNNALDALVTSLPPDEVADLLMQDPRMFVRRVFDLSVEQQITLRQLSDDELADLARPVAEALRQDGQGFLIQLDTVSSRPWCHTPTPRFTRGDLAAPMEIPPDRLLVGQLSKLIDHAMWG